MRDVPKTEVAAYVHGAGLVPVLALAASTGEPYSPAAIAILNAIMDPAITAIDLDDTQYQQGVAALVGYGVIAQSHADAIEALYVAPSGPAAWTYVAAVEDGPGQWRLVFECGSTQRSIGATTNDPAAHAAALIARGAI